jgi:hypothetical protein
MITYIWHSLALFPNQLIYSFTANALRTDGHIYNTLWALRFYGQILPVAGYLPALSGKYGLGLHRYFFWFRPD